MSQAHICEIPGEIRTMIYAHVLSPGTVHLLLRHRQVLPASGVVLLKPAPTQRPDTTSSSPRAQAGPQIHTIATGGPGNTVQHPRHMGPSPESSSSGQTDDTGALVNNDFYSLKTQDANASILRACRLFYCEARDILYADNTYEIPPYLLSEFETNFLPRIGARNAGLIRSVSIKYNRFMFGALEDSLPAVLEPLANLNQYLPGLREVRLSRLNGDLEDGYFDAYFSDNDIDEAGWIDDTQTFTTALKGIVVSGSNVESGFPRFLIGHRSKFVRMILTSRGFSVAVGVRRRFKTGLMEALLIPFTLGARSSIQKTLYQAKQAL